MDKKNYQTEMEKILKVLPTDPPPRLLLHSCCAPCSSAVLEELAQIFSITILYYNPNIYPVAEYERRRDEQKMLLNNLSVKIDLVEGIYDESIFYNAVIGHEAAPERGSRCHLCYKLRLEEAANYAKKNNFDFFTTTLSISPHKDSQAINRIGSELAEKIGVRYLFSDFKKKGRFVRSLELSDEYGLYRQNYCGCKFSFNNAGLSQED